MRKLRASVMQMRWAAIACLVWSASAAAETHKAVARPEPVRPEPNAFTNDPILGNGKRINGEEVKGLVAFTFDDGPNPETTPAVIDALKQYNVPAAFFIVTQRITGKLGEHSREVLRRELDAGFLVGSHSVTHTTLRHAGVDLLARE